MGPWWLVVDVTLTVGDDERGTLGDLQPLGQFEIGLQLAVEALAPGIQQHAFLLVIGEREDRLHLLRTAADRGGIVLREAGLENLVEPVGAGHVAPRIDARVGGTRQLAAGIALHGLGPNRVVLLGRQHRRQVGNLLKAERYVGADADLAALGLLGGNQDDTARSYRCTVDSGRSGILEYGDRLDILDHVGCVGHAINYHQYAVARGRVVVVALRTAAADRERGGFHRVTGLLDRHTGHAALQHRSQVRGAALGHIVQLDGGHGHREVLLALRAVTDGHDLADHHRIVLHHHVDLRAVHHGNALHLITDEREVERGIAVHRDRITAIDIGRDAVGRTLFYNRSTDQRILTRVGQTSRNRHPVLGLGRKHEYAKQQTHQKNTEEIPRLPRNCQIHFHRVKVNNYEIYK